ncbi:hypothetical protein [Bacteroides faecium]|uniref:Uncharacterized protein n=1 Tax=Bacteroides faecium TaxID=2715212 RepID=A0A6H0KQK2_9BACE|nr:hypothetical protein [Bacteroides faecium]QIU95565.1 hypothetical protein BacF7301_16020 [Bacteroides faecium]
MKTEVKKENGVFELNFSNIKNAEDVKEAICQCRLVESQLSGSRGDLSASNRISRGSIEILDSNRYGAILVPTGVWLFEPTLKKTDQCDHT